MQQIMPISKTRISALAKLKQKKFRHETQKVVLEGSRLMEQLQSYGVLPEELFITRPDIAASIPGHRTLCQADDLKRICDTEHPSELAGLYPIPLPRSEPFRRALYLDQVSDPGNMGTIFRTAAAFGIDCIMLSAQSCEVSNPKVIRASLGAVYKVPFSYVSTSELGSISARKLVLDMNGKIELKHYHPGAAAEIYILGSEAHGVDATLMACADSSLRISMPGKMESLNLAISAAILCFQIS